MKRPGCDRLPSAALPQQNPQARWSTSEGIASISYDHDHLRMLMPVHAASRLESWRKPRPVSLGGRVDRVSRLRAGMRTEALWEAEACLATSPRTVAITL